MMRLPLLLLFLLSSVYSWVTPTPVSYRRSSSSRPLQLAPANLEFYSSSLILSDDSNSWRDYVPLVVSILVIIDVLLGRPVANSILAPLQGVKEELAPPTAADEAQRRRERIDSSKIAQDALDLAYGSIETRDWLEKNKSAEQRMNDMRSTMDSQMEQVDRTLEETQKKLDSGDY